MEKIKARVVDVVQLSQNVIKVVFTPEVTIDFKPGQWIYVFTENDGEEIKRPYSIASPPSESLELCVVKVEGGVMSNYITSLKIGDEIEISKPFGIFNVKESDAEKIFIATGTGIAPFMSMIPYLFSKNFKNKITMVFGEKTKEDLIYQDVMKQYTYEYNFEYIPVISREDWEGEKGHVQDVIKKTEFSKDSEFYICGLKKMVLETEELLLSMGIDKENIHKERYD